MKLQLQDASLRLRLSEAEFARLLDGETLLSRTPLPGGALVLGLRLFEGEAFAFSGAVPALSLLAPRALLLDYQQRLPCREGIVARLETGDGALDLSLEVDVRDSVRTRGTRPKAAR